MASCSLFSAEMTEARDQHQPKQNKCFLFLLEYCKSLKYSTCPETPTQDELFQTAPWSCLQPVGVNFDQWPDSVVISSVHQENK